MGFSSGGDGVGRKGSVPVAEVQRQAVGEVLGDMEWCEGSFRPRKAVEGRDCDQGFVEVSCVHTMAPDPERCPQPGWHGRTLSPGLRAYDPTPGSDDGFFGSAPLVEGL